MPFRNYGNFSAYYGTDDLSNSSTYKFPGKAIAYSLSTSLIKSSKVRQIIKQDDVYIGDLLKNISNRHRRLSCLALLVKHKNGSYTLLPDEDCCIKLGDEILFCGNTDAMDSIHSTFSFPYMLRYVKYGESYRKGIIWNYFFAKRT